MVQTKKRSENAFDGNLDESTEKRSLSTKLGMSISEELSNSDFQTGKPLSRSYDDDPDNHFARLADPD